MIEPNCLKAVFFDAAGTLFYLTKTVGDHYALVGEEVGLNLDAKKLDDAFHSAWTKMPLRKALTTQLSIRKALRISQILKEVFTALREPKQVALHLFLWNN